MSLRKTNHVRASGGMGFSLRYGRKVTGVCSHVKGSMRPSWTWEFRYSKSRSCSNVPVRNGLDGALPPCAFAHVNIAVANSNTVFGFIQTRQPRLAWRIAAQPIFIVRSRHNHLILTRLRRHAGSVIFVMNTHEVLGVEDNERYNKNDPISRACQMDSHGNLRMPIRLVWEPMLQSRPMSIWISLWISLNRIICVNCR